MSFRFFVLSNPFNKLKESQRWERGCPHPHRRVSGEKAALKFVCFANVRMWTSALPVI
jgi:hypothetical protein